MTKILVTGGGGFIGQHLVAQWTRAGRDLILPSRATLADPVLLDAAMEGVETVVHLAGRVHVMHDRAIDPLTEYRRVNVDLTSRLAQAAVRAGVRRFILASSVKAMGESNLRPWTEEDRPAPVDPYGVSKLEAEHALAALAARTGMGTAALRLPLVYGPGVGANFLRLLRLVDRGIPLPFGAIANRRSLAGVSNVVAAIDALSAATLAPGERFFISDQDDLSTPGLIRALAASLSRRVRLVAVPWQWIPGTLRPPALARLLDSLTVESALLTRRTGWRPVATVSEELDRTVSWYRVPPDFRRS